MFRSLLTLLALSIAGDALAQCLDAPIPGSVVGLLSMVLMFLVLGRTDQGSARIFDAAAPYFPFLFVPAAVGVVASMDVLYDSWPVFLAAIVGSTAAAILATGYAAELLFSKPQAGEPS